MLRLCQMQEIWLQTTGMLFCFFIFKWVMSLENHFELWLSLSSRATDAFALDCDLMQGALHMVKLIAQQIKPLHPQLELNMEKILI